MCDKLSPLNSQALVQVPYREKGRWAIWESTGSYISIVLLGRGWRGLGVKKLQYTQSTRVSLRRNWVPTLPPPQAGVSPPWNQREGEQHRLRVSGLGDPIRTTIPIKPWHSVYSMGRGIQSSGSRQSERGRACTPTLRSQAENTIMTERMHVRKWSSPVYVLSSLWFHILIYLVTHRVFSNDT